MPTLTINGRDVDVGDDFLHLSPEQQNATVDEIAHSMEQTAPTSASGDAISNVAHFANDVGRAVATGVPILGGLADKADAATNATLAPVLNGLFSPDQQLHGSWSDRYHQALATQQGSDRQFADVHPVVNGAAQLAGGVGATAPLAVAGAGLVGQTALRTAPGLAGILGRAAAAGAEGAAIGGTDAWTRGQSPLTGLAFGAAGGVGGEALGQGAQAIRNVFRPADEKAASWVMRQVLHDAPTADGATQRLAQLGPDAIVADLGPSVRGQLDQTAIRPGPARKMAMDALRTRQDAAGDRIAQALTDAMGPRTNVLETADQIAAARSAAAGPLYEATRDVAVPMNDTIAELLSRPAFQSAQAAAVRKAANEGVELDMSQPTVRALDYTKRALDDQIGHAVMHGNRDDARVLTGLKQGLLEQVDQAVPDYAAARQAYAGYSEIADALANGQKAFSNSMSPDALTRQLHGMSDAAREAYQEGARQQVAQAMGTARTDAAGAQSLFNRGYNREKLQTVIGDDASKKILDALSSEKQFQATANAVGVGSQTAPRLFSAETVPHEIDVSTARGAFTPSAIGARLANAVLSPRTQAQRTEIARLLLSHSLPAKPVARIGTRDAIAGALLGLSPQADR